MIFVEDLKNNYASYNMPERFVETLPSICPECGGYLWINETLTELSCSDPRCKGKVVMRIKAICKDLNILYFGESAINKFVDYFDITNPLDIFELDYNIPLSDAIGEAIADKVIAQVLEHKKFYLWEFVQIANLPFIRTSARKIFQGYESLSEAYEDIEIEGVEFIQKKLGIADKDEVSIQAVKIYNSLIEFKEDLLEGESNVEILTMDGKEELNVVCSDQVGGNFTKKAEFYNYIHSTFGGKIKVNFLSSATKSIDYLIWQGADGSEARYTNKVKKVEGYNAKGCNIPIMTANQFIEEMKNL